MGFQSEDYRVSGCRAGPSYSSSHPLVLHYDYGKSSVAGCENSGCQMVGAKVYEDNPRERNQCISDPHGVARNYR